MTTKGYSSIVRGETQIEDMQSRHVLEKQFVQPLGPSITPDVLNRRFFEANNESAVTVTDFKNGAPGQRIYILGDGFTTIEHGTFIKTSTGANKLLSADVVYTFTYFQDGLTHKWVEDADTTGGGGGGSTVVAVSSIRTAGDVVVSATSPTAIDTSTDLVVPAVAGDKVLVSVSSGWNNGGGSSRLDVVTIVSAAIVNYISGAGASGSGVLAWRGLPDSTFITFGGSVLYTVQSGDISGGNVTFRLVGWVASSNRTLLATTSARLHFAVVNFGQ